MRRISSIFEYVNQDAPKGGRINLSSPGTFDSLNTIILRGTAPLTLGLIKDTLMVQSKEELGVAVWVIGHGGRVSGRLIVD